MMGALGAKKKPPKPTPLKDMATKDVKKVLNRLTTTSQKKPLDPGQMQRLSRAQTIVANRSGKNKPKNPGQPTAPYPTEAPPPGHRWRYNATTNSYAPDPIPLSSQPSTDFSTFTGGGTTGGGGGGTYQPTPAGVPDFTGFTADGMPTTQKDLLAPGSSTASPLDAALVTAAGKGTGSGLSTPAMLALGAAAVGAFVLMKKGRKR